MATTKPSTIRNTAVMAYHYYDEQVEQNKPKEFYKEIAIDYGALPNEFNPKVLKNATRKSK